MRIAFDQSGAARLDDPYDFRAFKVTCPSALPEQEAAFAKIGRFDAGHLWVARAWLKQAGPHDEAWSNGLTGMIAYAASAGWVDDAGAIRAHIDFV